MCDWRWWSGYQDKEDAQKVSPMEKGQDHDCQRKKQTVSEKHEAAFSMKRWKGRMRTVPGEWGGGIHMSTTPWPSRTDTPPLAFALNAPRSGSTKQNQWIGELQWCTLPYAGEHHHFRQPSINWLNSAWITHYFHIWLGFGHGLQFLSS